MRRYLILSLLAVLTLATLIIPAIRSVHASDEYSPDQIVLRPDQAPRLADAGNEYLSGPIQAPRPFSHVMVRREASVPKGATLTLFVSASPDGQTWSPWSEVTANDDLWLESDGPDVLWSQVFDVGLVARFWQVRGVFAPAGDGTLPVLRQVDVNTVDVSSGPEPDPNAASERQFSPAAAVPRPAVVSRTAWGSPDGQGSRERPAYYAVKHLVVHHTADGNSLYPSETSWAQRVRAIWSYHAITRGWGDIGYNYLIDPNGVIYEGRAGGDDAVAFHDTANYGSMGVSLLGTYQSVTPTAATQDALVRLLAWKAAQKGIDPHGSSYYYGCTISKYCNPFNAGGVVPNIAGHRQVTPGHTTCPGDATMALLSQIKNRVQQLIGAGGTNPDTTKLELTNVQYERTTLASGELLRVSFTVKNTGQTTVAGQAPSVDLSAGGGLGNASNAYVYRQDECFNGDTAGSYPAFPKESERVRVTLGISGWDAANGSRCAGATSDYPWRWGLNGELAPGQQQTIIGYVQFRTPGTYTLHAGLVQEYVKYHVEGSNQVSVSITKEQLAPEMAAYDQQLQPLAHIYRLAEQPDSLLARSGEPGAVGRGAYAGSFAWKGELLNWGEGGPFGLSDQFLIEQTRSFVVPVSGAYTFRTTSDDGSWLLVDGQIVVNNYGLHPAQDAEGTIQLSAGAHILSFLYFDRAGQALAGYAMRAPGSSDFRIVPEPFDTIPRFGGIFTQSPELLIAADDRGGSGVASVRWSLNGTEWQEQAGALLRIPRLQTGTYRLRYQATDMAGNRGVEHEMNFSVNTGMSIRSVYLPLVSR